MWVGLIVIFLTVLSDQISKFFVYENMADGEHVVFCAFFNLVKVWNTGVSFSMFNGHGQTGAVILTVFALCVAVFLFYWMLKETNKLKDSFNKLLSSENKRIQSVVPSILNSIPYIIITTSEHVNGKVYFSDILYTENSLSSKSAKKLFKIMNKFVEDNYGLDFTWDQENDKNNTITSSDGFLSYKLDLRNIENPFIGFVDLDDAFTASLRIPHEGGELGDYIEFYKDAFLKRQSVPIHTIPKQFKNVYLKFQGKNKTLKK